ncbi:MAG: hypothetical protein ACK587_05665 [Cyanobacteriota bacterium]|jgi:hypothetical protein
MAWNTNGGSDADTPPPITPHAAPSLDAEGHLSYIGEDGRRYVVGLPPDMDQESLERVMATLQRGGALFHQIEHLARRWIARVSGPDLDARAALVLLVTTLETSLEEIYPEDGPPADG